MPGMSREFSGPNKVGQFVEEHFNIQDASIVPDDSMTMLLGGALCRYEIFTGHVYKSEQIDRQFEQQRAAVLACQQAVHRGQREWQSKQKQVKAYDALEQRHDNAQAERLKRLDQRLMDDLASRAHTSKN